MSLIPQRKKTAEEIAELRDQLGVRRPKESSMQTATAIAATAPQLAYQPSSTTTKPVRSLKRAERDPVKHKVGASPFSNLPARRHSADELQEIRRRDALARFDPHALPALFPFPAPRWVVIPGYLFTFFGLACHFWKVPMAATAGTGFVALLIAAYILLRRPLSRHHAGFIGILTLLILVFAALHYFPQLRHAS